MSVLWNRFRQPAASKTLPPTPTDPDDGALAPTPGLKPHPLSIAQLAMPSSPDESSESSNTSHEVPLPEQPVNVASRRPNRLRKPPPRPPPSSYPFSFVAENPSPDSNFPYSFSTPVSAASSFITTSTRALSGLPTRTARKLTKRRPSSSSVAQPSTESLPPMQRRSTFNLTFRRSRHSFRGTQSEDGHSSAPVPPLPRPSPLAANMPAFFPFHARRRDSWHAQSASEPLRHSTPPTTDSTLSEMAWTGIGSNRVHNQGGWRSTWSLTEGEAATLPRPRPRFTIGDEVESPIGGSPILSSRPPLIRRDAVTASPKRRWTLAMALTDEGISDEILVEKLEILRSRSRVGSYAASDGNVDDPDDWERVWAVCNDELDIPPPPVPPKDASMPPLPSPSSMPTLPIQHAPATPSWQSARRALLTCRELVRTERHFLLSLHSLLGGQTRQPPPPLMRAYASTLAKESAKLLRRMEDDPSAWGVAAALLGAEETLEPAFVAWCGVVGSWFIDGPSSTRNPRRLSKSRLRVSSEPGFDEEEEFQLGTVSASSTLSAATSRKRVSVPSVGSAARFSSIGPTSRPVSTLSSLSLNMTSTQSDSGHGSPRTRPRTHRPRDERPPVRDLAILPTQRVMRYVLLYRDLLEHTPARSPARALVAQAVDVAVRMAQRCDRAQGNAAFLGAGQAS
ncbi:DH domain-containing protein [Mycena chlorophos]|uniref:DH domain-containing protein n=1 Tax=Mycena chlorophos TaxID=658473 RepID=A0A8H6T858_MYCCL|nr:DH domain-containing protein [Mycena chlorophos]